MIGMHILLGSVIIGGTIIISIVNHSKTTAASLVSDLNGFPREEIKQVISGFLAGEYDEYIKAPLLR